MPRHPVWVAPPKRRPSPQWWGSVTARSDLTLPPCRVSHPGTGTWRVEGAAGFAGCVDRNENVDLTHPAPGTIVATLQDSYHNHYNHHNHALDCTVVGCLRLVGGVLGVGWWSLGGWLVESWGLHPSRTGGVTFRPINDGRNVKCITMLHSVHNRTPGSVSKRYTLLSM